jgi:VCBS repeat-containing protein
MATQTTGGGSTTSFTKTPQAQDDLYGWTEEQLLASGLYSSTSNIITLNVMSNDLGGNAKTLWSIDDGDGNTLAPDYQLLTQDGLISGVSTWELTSAGNLIRINNGKIELKLVGSLAALGVSSVDGLSANQSIHDEFVYAIRLGNGTLSQARVTFNILGQNDAAAITASATEHTAVTEAGGLANAVPGDPSASGQLAVNDVDSGENHFQTPGSLAGTYGTYTFNPTTGVWGYTLNQSLADPLTAGQVVYDHLIVMSADGTATYDIKVNILGTNDAAILSADTRNLTETNSATDVSASGTLTISDVDSPATFVEQAGTVGSYGTFAINAAGAWTYTASSAHN